jgi:steroid delta-isomerase-like uncharacterized protein/uncharacterized protein (TIGR02246 family)
MAGSDVPLASLTEMAAAVNAGDAARYARTYAPDAVIVLHGGERLEGRGAIEAYERQLLGEFPGARLGWQSIWRKGDRAAVHYAVTGKTPGGQAMGHEGLLFYRFAPSGLVAEERRYLDSLTPMAQLGALGPSAVTRPLPELAARPAVHVATGATSENDNVAAVRKWMDAWAVHDGAAAAALLAPDVAVDEMVEPRPRDAARDWFRMWATALPEVTVEVVDALGVGDFVLAETIVTGSLEGPLGPVSASGRPVTLHRALLVQFAGGKIARVKAFLNGKELAQAAGQWPPGRPDSKD